MGKRFYGAMAAYAALAVLAAFTLDGRFRLGVWLFLALFALKTLIAQKANELRSGAMGTGGTVSEEQGSRSKGDESD